LDKLLASDEVVAAFALLIGECPQLLNAALEGCTLGSQGNTDLSARCYEQPAVRVDAPEERLYGDLGMTAMG